VHDKFISGRFYLEYFGVLVLQCLTDAAKGYRILRKIQRGTRDNKRNRTARWDDSGLSTSWWLGDGY
jgi:hypothetical protein